MASWGNLAAKKEAQGPDLIASLALEVSKKIGRVEKDMFKFLFALDSGLF